MVDLITQLWPNSIDKLDRESGVVNGVKPIFYTDVDSDFIKEVQPSFQLAISVHNQIYRAFFCHVRRGNFYSLSKRIRNALNNLRSRDTIELGADQCQYIFILLDSSPIK